METITSKNLLDFIKTYFASLGLEDDASKFFNAKNFTEGLVLKLPAVCIVPSNKPSSSRSKQTHIHITGNSRYFFFNSAEINSAVTSSDDIRQNVYVSKQNINNLRKLESTNEGLSFSPSHTMLKIACRATQETQVQISKLRYDGDLFIDLRYSLFENDLLIFLKSRLDNQMVAIGIPFDFYYGQYEFQNDIFSGLESSGTITLKNALTAIINEYQESDVIDGDEAISDAVYQEMVNNATAIVDNNQPTEYIPPINKKTLTSSRPPTNPSLGKLAITSNNYCCAINMNHPTFIKKDGNKYMEVHHLIPLEWQSEFTYKLDTLANLIPICPLCHKLIHYGRMDEKKSILTQLYNERKDALKESHLNITLEQLLKFYE